MSCKTLKINNEVVVISNEAPVKKPLGRPRSTVEKEPKEPKEPKEKKKLGRPRLTPVGEVKEKGPVGRPRIHPKKEKLCVGRPRLDDEALLVRVLEHRCTMRRKYQEKTAKLRETSVTPPTD